MSAAVDVLFLRTWWIYDPTAAGYSPVYHWFNLVEGAAWCSVALLIVRRYLRNRGTPIELCYAASFVTFGVSDFREAYALQSWLIVFKGLNLGAILYLRRLVIGRRYPTSRTYY